VKQGFELTTFKVHDLKAVHLNVLRFPCTRARDFFVTVHGFACPADAIHIIVVAVVVAGCNAFAVRVQPCKTAMVVTVLHCVTSLT
jgi:hypothetical protein